MKFNFMGLFKNVIFWQVLAPFSLALFVLFFAAKVFYMEGRRESLAAHLESQLIAFTLRYSAPSIQNRGSVVVVSATDQDMNFLQRAPQPLLNDAHILEYARVLESVSQSNPRYVFVSWLAGAHPISDSYLKPIFEVIDKLNMHGRVILGISFGMTGRALAQMPKKYQFAEAADCFYRVNLYCTYLGELNLVITHVVKKIWDTVPEHHVSLNLPHVFPNFLVNAPDHSKLLTYRFLDVRDGLAKNFPSGSVVFIGNDSQQNVAFKGNQILLQRSYLAQSIQRNDLTRDGIPWHVQWAAIAQMFVDRTSLAVVPQSLNLVIVVMTCVIVVLTMWIYRGLAFGSFLFGAVLLPLGNVLGAKIFRVYIPVVDVIFWSLLVFVGAAFLSISSVVIARRLIAERRARQQKDQDVRTNFISIISHNLNTPVAQVRGLLDVMLDTPGFSPYFGEIRTARLLSEKLTIAVRFMLAHASLQSAGELWDYTAVRSIVDDFKQGLTFTFKKLNSPYQEFLFSVVDEVAFEKLPGTPRLYSQVLQGCILLLPGALNAYREENQLMDVGIRCYKLDGNLCIEISSQEVSLDPGESDFSNGFLISIIEKFIFLMLNLSAGHMEKSRNAEINIIRLKWSLQ